MNSPHRYLAAPQEERDLLKVVFSVFLGCLTVGLPLPVIALFVQHELGLNAILVGIAIGLESLATIFTREYAGHMADTSDAKNVVRKGMTFCSCAGIFYLAASLSSHSAWLSYGILLIGRLVLGYGESQMLTGALSWGFGLVGPSRSGKVMAWQGMAIFSAFAAGAPLGLLLYQEWGFAALGVSTLLLPVFALALNAGIRGVTPQGKGKRLPLRRVLGIIWLPGLALGLAGVGFAVIGAFSSLYFTEQHWGNAGLALTFFGGAFVLVRIPWSNLPDKVGGIGVSLVSFACEMIGLALLWIGGNPLMGWLGAALAGAGCSLIFPALGVEVVRSAPAEARGTAIGGYAAFQDIAYAVSGPLAGILAMQCGYASIFLAAALCDVLGFATTLLLGRRIGGRA